MKAFLRSERGLETVEWAVVAGLILAGTVVLAVVVIGLWTKVHFRLMGGNASWSPDNA